MFFHYALYDSVRVPSGHGSDELLRVDLEAAIRPYAVDLILTGHDHLYERTYPVYEVRTKLDPRDIYLRLLAGSSLL